MPAARSEHMKAAALPTSSMVTLAQRRGGLEGAEHLAEVAHARCGQGLDRPGRDRVDPRALGAEVERQVAHRRLQAGLGHAHHVVVLQRADRAEVSQGQDRAVAALHLRSEEHTSELQSLMRLSYAVFCLNK